MKLSATISVSRRPRTDNEAELASVITNKTMQMGLKDFDQAVKDLKGAGIVVGEDQMTLEASKVKITNNGTTAALFTDGKVSADYIDAKTIVTNGLSANTIDANKATLKNLTAENFTLTQGNIACFNFSSTAIGTNSTSTALPNAMYLTNDVLIFNGENKKQAVFGTNAGILGIQMLASLRDTEYTGLAKTGMYINVNSGSLWYTNDAIQIGGGCVSGLRLRTEIVSSGKTLDKLTNIAILKTNDTVYLPDLGQEKQYDGHVLLLRQDSYTPAIAASGSNGVAVNSTYVNKVAYDDWKGYAIFVFIASMSAGSYKGLWYKL